jgi:hypothetical protein
MSDVKYVIVDGSAIVFSGAIQHKDMVGYNKGAEGAGFVRFVAEKDPEYGDTIVVAKCYGRSISLNVESREEDSMIVTRQICRGY